MIFEVHPARQSGNAAENAYMQSLPADREVVALDQTAPQAFAGSPPVDNIGSSEDTALRQEEAGRNGGAEGIESRRQHHSHGSALPR